MTGLDQHSPREAGVSLLELKQPRMRNARQIEVDGVG